MAAYLVQSADPVIKDTIEHQLTTGYYQSSTELVSDIAKLTLGVGSVKKEFYFPLTGNIDEGDGNPFTVGDSFLFDYRYDIADAIQKHQNRDIENIATYFNLDDGVQARQPSESCSVPPTTEFSSTDATPGRTYP